MNKTLKFIILLVGIGLLIYGIYMLFVPEAAVSIGSLEIGVQDNTNAFISIGLGIVVLAIGFIGGKRLS